MYNIAIPNMLNGVSQQPPQVRFPTQCEELVNGYASPTESLTKRYPTEAVADFTGNGDTEGKGKLHIIDRGEGVEAYAIMLKDDGITAWDLVNNAVVPVNLPSGGNYSYLGGGSVNDLERDLTLTTIADYTFVCNRNKTIAMTNDTIAERDPEAFVWVKTGNYGTTYTITVELLDSSGSTVGSTLVVNQKTLHPDSSGIPTSVDGYLDASGATIDGEFFPEGTSVIDTRLIAAQLTVLLNNNFAAPSNFSDLTATRTDYGIHIVLNTNNPANPTVVDFRVSVGDGLSGEGLRVIGEEVQAFEYLPVIAPDGIVTKIEGLPEVNEDDYYVKFEANVQGETGEGVWVETVAPGLSYRLDSATMPHALIRKFDGNGDPYFMFTPIDGSADANDVFWDDRLVGDLVSNPNPSFVGAEISSIFSYQGRLGILSGEAVSVSEAGNFFNFFRTTVVSLLDSDPIDVYSAYPQVTKFRYGIPLGNRLILFSNKAQMVLTSPDTELLTPRTVILEPAGQYEAVADCMPAQVDQEIYFPFKRGDNYTGVRDMVVNIQDASLIAAPEVTAHVPKYILGLPKAMKASPFDRTLVVLTEQDQSALYVYKWYDQGNERVQSSWSKWTFPGVAIQSVGWYESRLILYVFNPDSQTYGLREIDLRENRLDEDSGLTVRLDNRRYFANTSSNQIVVDGVTNVGQPSQESVFFRFGSIGAVGGTGSIELTGTFPPTVITPGTPNALLPEVQGPALTSTLPNLTQEFLEVPYVSGYAVPMRTGITAQTFLEFSATRSSPDAISQRQFSVYVSTDNGSYSINISDSRFGNSTSPPSGFTGTYSSEKAATVFVNGYELEIEYLFSWTEPDTTTTMSFQGSVTVKCVDGPDVFTNVRAGILSGVTGEDAQSTTFATNSCSSQVYYNNFSQHPVSFGGQSESASPLIPGDIVVYASGPNAGQQVEEVSRVYDDVSGNTTITLSGTGGASVFHGNPYEFRYRFSQPYFRIGSQTSSLGSGRFQIRNMNVNYDESGPFRAEVSAVNPLVNSTYVYERGSTVNSSFVNAPLESGTMRIPVMGVSEQFNVDLINDTPYPSKFTSAEVEATYSGRYRRI